MESVMLLPFDMPVQHMSATTTNIDLIVLTMKPP